MLIILALDTLPCVCGSESTLRLIRIERKGDRSKGNGFI